MSVEANFKKHKRFLETIETAKYNVISNGKSYKVSVYNKLGTPKGYLVLHSNGEECEREEAIAPYKLFITFNSYLSGIVNQSQVEMKKPTAVFQDTINLLEQVKPYIQQSEDELENAISKIKELDYGFKHYKTIHDNSLKVYEEVMGTGELDELPVKKVSDLMDEFTLLQYKHLRLQLKSKEDFNAISHELKRVNVNGENRKTIVKALDVFGHLTSDKYLSGIHDNLKQFEANDQGVNISYYDEPDWEKRLIESTDERSNKQFQTGALAMLRN
jgi:hypothetical protein